MKAICLIERSGIKWKFQMIVPHSAHGNDRTVSNNQLRLCLCADKGQAV